MAALLEFGGQGFAVPNRHQTDVLQAMQGPPFGPWNPPLQTQLCRSLDPLKLDEFAAQAKQTEREGPAVPSKYVFAGQSVHVLAKLAPSAVEYLPDSQETHVLSDVAVTAKEYLPATHAVQVCASSFE